MRDPIFATSKRYLISKGSEVLGEVYVLDHKYITSFPKLVQGLTCRKAGKSA